MPYGKPGEILCAVCGKRLKESDQTARLETTNVLVHAACLSRAVLDAGREHVRLLLYRAGRCPACIAKTLRKSPEEIASVLENFGPDLTTLAARCDDCGRLGVVYTIR